MLARNDYEAFEPHIRELVRALHYIGIGTRSSCEGHLDPDKKPYPHVTIDVKPPVSPKGFLREFLRLIGDWNLSGKEVWCFLPHYIVEEEDGPLLLYLEPREANSTRDPAVLHKLQIEAKELAVFFQESGLLVHG